MTTVRAGSKQAQPKAKSTTEASGETSGKQVAAGEAATKPARSAKTVASGEASAPKTAGGKYIAPIPPRVAAGEATNASTGAGKKTSSSEAGSKFEPAKPAKQLPNLTPKAGEHLSRSDGVKVSGSEAGR